MPASLQARMAMASPYTDWKPSSTQCSRPTPRGSPWASPAMTAAPLGSQLLHQASFRALPAQTEGSQSKLRAVSPRCGAQDEERSVR